MKKRSSERRSGLFGGRGKAKGGKISTGGKNDQKKILFRGCFFESLDLKGES